MLRTLRTLGLLACSLLVGRGAQAQESSQDPRVAEAKTACGAGDYQKGVRLLAELYTVTNDAIWIFNQGRCYQQNEQLTQALARFKEFLRKSKGAADEDVREARNFITEIESELQRAQPTPKSTTAAGVEPAAVATQSRAEENPGRGLRYAGVGAWILGGAALATGAAFSFLVNKTSNDTVAQTNKNVVDWSAVSGKYADGHRYETLQWTFYGVGAAAVIAGSVLYWLGAASDQPRASASLVSPLVTAKAAGASLHMAF